MIQESDVPDFYDLSAVRSREWLVTNGRGGYAMAAVNQMLTRRYHGLLVAAVRPPVERFVLLAKLDATVIDDGLTYELATNEYPEAVHPQGYKLIESFSPRPHPTWRFRAGKALIEQRLWMVEVEDSTFVQFRLLEGPPSVQLAVRPLCTSRHYHELTRYEHLGPPTVEEGDGTLRFSWAGGRPSWLLSHNGAFRERADWYYQFELAEEARRGFDHTQDLFMPGVISAELRRADAEGLVIVATTGTRAWVDWRTTGASPRRKATLEKVSADSLASALTEAAGDFLVRRAENERTIIAGYPWFGDWGRDTFISLPGLCLITKRFAEARGIIESFASHVDRGMIPNRFPDQGETPEYNTIDASLWYIDAIGWYLQYTGDWPFVADRMFGVAADILQAHETGTRHGIRVDEDGLLAGGEAGFALTWMDARVNGLSITPRIGKPVEINALWFNALSLASQWAERLGETRLQQRWGAIADRCARSFNLRFWNEAAGCMYDVVDVNGAVGTADGSVRPNQLIAVSLRNPVLERSRWRAVVDICRDRLLTPMGLRTLDPSDPSYRGRYEGDGPTRDSAYHQGTVWPWLLGPFITAYLRSHGSTASTHLAARGFLDGIETHLSHAGMGSVSEVADGDAPYRPGGCPWQAWSVAEPLRALVEDIANEHVSCEADECIEKAASVF